VRGNPQHRRLLTVISANPALLFQPLRHQWNVCHVSRHSCEPLRATNTSGRKQETFLYEYRLHGVFLPQLMHNRTPLFGSTILKHGHLFDYWNQPQNVRLRSCYLDCHEAGLCCYLVIHIETLLCPLQLFYFHLLPIYWLSLVYVISHYRRRTGSAFRKSLTWRLLCIPYYVLLLQ
jgi:hypothetical protein